MQTFQGLAVSDGLTVGPVVRIDRGAAGLHRIVCDPFRERALYEAAIVLAKDELNRLQQHACGQDADILMFQIALLEDESFTNEIGDYIAAGAGSAAAVERAEQIFAGRLKNVDDDYIRERSVDVCDACRRVVDILDGRPSRRLHLTEPSILAAELFYPSDLFGQAPGMILGLASETDSETSHAAIMARSMGIPAVFQLGKGVAAAAAGCRAVVDAEHAQLIIDPTAAQLRQVKARRQELQNSNALPDSLAAAPCRTRDGTPFVLLASAACAAPEAIQKAIQAGASGIGLLRTESVVIKELTEAQQVEAYKTCIKNSGGKPITVRTCDWAADDCGQWMDGVQTRMEEETTALTQLSALMQAAVEAPEGALQVLFPMIPDVDAWRTRMDQMKRCNESLKEKGLPFCGNLPVGCLIEIPAAALMAGEIIDAGADFLAVDLDDLVQYTCGVSRREKPTPADNPAVLRLVQDVMHAAQTRGVPLYLCGIMQKDLETMPAFMRIGVRNFCVESVHINTLKSILMQTEL